MLTGFFHSRVLLMDLSQAAFGLDIRAASRVYFISPVLNPQVEAQAIGRVRRINQEKPVSVETLVLKGSIDEVLLERKRHMTQAEHRQVKSILDIRPIYNWIKNASIMPMPHATNEHAAQMAPLGTPLRVFSRGFGRPLHPDEGLVLDGQLLRRDDGPPRPTELAQINGFKRARDSGLGGEATLQDEALREADNLISRPARRVRFVGDSEDE